MRDTLSWLPVAGRIAFKTNRLTHADTVVGFAPAYIRNLCNPVLTEVGRRLLRSAAYRDMQATRRRTSTQTHRVPSRVLDRSPVVFSHCTYTLLSLTLCSIYLLSYMQNALFLYLLVIGKAPCEVL